jgi:hypothetical protein
VTGINVEHTAIQTVCNRCSFELDEEERIRREQAKERARRAREAWKTCGTVAFYLVIALFVGLLLVIGLYLAIQRKHDPEAEQKAEAIAGQAKRDPEAERLADLRARRIAAEKAEAQRKTEEEKRKKHQQKQEDLAAADLRYAKLLASDGKLDKAKERLQLIVDDFPRTKAAKEAKELLKDYKD